ncbi:MAG: DNRLRE domain-containing protein, partial [Clostridiales bacterium]|nr:DNRLRE domain-containing protein [Clostridiales bacterium]
SKTFIFDVIRNVTDKEDCVRLDAERIDYPYISIHENGSKEIIMSLQLIDSGVYGSDITWSSSNDEYLNNSGRVVRPRYDEEDVAITLSATISKDGYSITKDFSFTVLADEKFIDPMFMSDEEFFGVWDGDNWTIEGKWNYSYPGLEPMGEAAKTGDYTSAKERLFEYFKNRKPEDTLQGAARNTGWSNMRIDDFYHLQGSEYYQGETTISNEWQVNYADVKPSYIAPGASATYSIRAWYNEASYAEIARVSSSDASIRPKIELEVNGSLRTFEAIDDLNIRAGDYKNTNLNDYEYLTIQNFGSFLGNDTRQAVIKFDFSGLEEGDEITSARLVLYSRVLPSFSGEKRLIIIKEPTNTWSSDTATWNSFPGYVFSYNGLPGKNDWGRPEGADVEYWYQMCRFNGWSAIASEYLETRDETYAYKAIRIMEDYLIDVGDWRMSSRAGGYDPNGIRGGFTRTLDALGKNGSWMSTMDIFLKSEYASPDFCTAMLKNMWDTTNFLTHYQSASGNWRQYEYQSMLTASLQLSEFTDSQAGRNWRKLGAEELESMIFYNHLPDGSYIEATGGYNTGAYSGYKSYKTTMLENGVEVSPEYDDMLHKAAYYNALLYASDGSGLQYGDSSPGKRSATLFEDIYKWYDDKE